MGDDVTTPEPCPECGAPLTWGYGLAMGGPGMYVMCLGEIDIGGGVIETECSFIELRHRDAKDDNDDA
jgi:hypothetical protein